MPIDPKRSGGPSSRRCSLRERLALERKMLHCLALPGREFADGRIEHFGMTDLERCLLGIPARIRMTLISERRMNFAFSGPTASAQPVDRTPLGNGSEPSCERAARIVGLTRLMNGQQRLLHDIIYEIGWYSLAARHPLDEGDAVAQ